METTERLHTLKEAEQELGTYNTLLHYLIERDQIPYRRVGTTYIFDEAGFALLRQAVASWRNRPRVRVARKRCRRATA